jgi:prophage maintenance system killer protein
VLTRTFLRLNDHELQMDTDSAEALIVKVAAGDLDARELANELRVFYQRSLGPSAT